MAVGSSSSFTCLFEAGIIMCVVITSFWCIQDGEEIIYGAILSSQYNHFANINRENITERNLFSQLICIMSTLSVAK
jgi:hypothetical protein